MIVIHAGSEDGSTAGVQLIQKAGSVNGDYHGQMHNSNFEKWVKAKMNSTHISKVRYLVMRYGTVCSAGRQMSDKFANEVVGSETGIACDGSTMKH